MRKKSSSVWCVCEQCGVAFKRPPSEMERSRHIYCSRACFAAIRRGKKRGAPKLCSIPGCERPLLARGWCSRHYALWLANGDPERRFRNPYGEGYIDGHGYRYRSINWRKVAEHRQVMEEMLGRPLEHHEHVHHLNGIKTDNRPENLILTTKHDHQRTFHCTFRSDTHKECTRCHEIKPRTEFSPVRTPGKDPNQPRCKRCNAASYHERKHARRLLE